MAAWAVAAAVQLVLAAADLRDGQRMVEALHAEPVEALLDASVVDELEEAAARFERSQRRVRSLAVAPLRVLPVAGRQLRSVDALAGSAAAITSAGASGAEHLLGRVEAGMPAGRARVDFVHEVAVVARRTRAVLARADLGPARALIGPLAEARARLASEVQALERAMEDLDRSAGAIAGLLDGPSRVLLLAANNAEMRAGSGMFLNAGVLELEAGRLRLRGMQPTADLRLDEAVPIPDEIRRLWGWMEPGREWRNLAAWPRFDVTGPLAARMWEARTGEAVDAVVAVDVLALAALLRVAGPVTVAGEDGAPDLVIDHTTVVDWALLGQYAEAEAAGGDHDARRDRLGDVAAAVVRGLDRGGLDPIALVRELRGAQRGRHLLAWAARREVQEAFRHAGLDGGLERESLAVAVLNRGANKLDQFLDVRVELELAPGGAGRPGRATLTVELRNRTPQDAPAYVRGPTEGRYDGILALSLPGGATGVELDEDAELVAAGSDGPSYTVGLWVSIPPGASVRHEVRFEQPPGSEGLRIVPAARHPGPVWTIRGVPHPDGPPNHVPW